MFEDTFSEYHRLSTALASQQDVTAAVDLWRDYLGHVEETFLKNPLPQDDYSALSEQHRLCGVHTKIIRKHKNLIDQQKQVNFTFKLFQMKSTPNCCSQYLRLVGYKLAKLRSRSCTIAV